MTHADNIHPGEILLEEFMFPRNITPYRLAKDTGMTPTRVDEIIKGKRDITPDTAMRLSRYFKVTPQFWLNLQQHHDLMELKHAGKNYDHIGPYDESDHAKKKARPELSTA